MADFDLTDSDWVGYNAYTRYGRGRRGRGKRDSATHYDNGSWREEYREQYQDLVEGLPDPEAPEVPQELDPNEAARRLGEYEAFISDVVRRRMVMRNQMYGFGSQVQGGANQDAGWTPSQGYLYDDVVPLLEPGVAVDDGINWAQPAGPGLAGTRAGTPARSEDHWRTRQDYNNIPQTDGGNPWFEDKMNDLAKAQAGPGTILSGGGRAI